MPVKLPYTKSIITPSGRQKTLYPITCANCDLKIYGFRKDDGKRFCSHICSTTFQYKNGRDGKEATKKAIEKTKSMTFRASSAIGERHWNWQGGILHSIQI